MFGTKIGKASVSRSKLMSGALFNLNYKSNLQSDAGIDIVFVKDTGAPIEVVNHDFPDAEIFVKFMGGLMEYERQNFYMELTATWEDRYNAEKQGLDKMQVSIPADSKCQRYADSRGIGSTAKLQGSHWAMIRVAEESGFGDVACLSNFEMNFLVYIANKDHLLKVNSDAPNWTVNRVI